MKIGKKEIMYVQDNQPLDGLRPKRTKGKGKEIMNQ